MRRIGVLIALFLSIYGHGLEMKISAQYHGERDIPFLYRTTVLAQYEPLLDDRVAFIDRDIFMLNLELIQDTFRMKVSVPYVFLLSSENKRGWGEMNVELEQTLWNHDRLYLSIKGGIDYALTEGTEKYYLERNVGSGTFHLYSSLRTEFSVLNGLTLYGEIGGKRIGKTDSERRFDTFDTYHYGPEISATLGNVMTFSLVNHTFVWDIHSSWNYRTSMWDSYEQSAVDKTEFMTWELISELEWLLFDSAFLQIGIGMHKFTVPRGAASPIFGVGVGYQI